MLTRTHEAAEETIVTGRYFLHHRFEQADSWFKTWTGELFRVDDEEAARAAEIEAHKALDRSYGGPAKETRLTLKTNTVTERVVVVPAMWEVGTRD